MAKVNLKLYLSISLLIFPFIVAKAQMVNKGEIIIEKGTNDVSTFFNFMNEKDATFINNDNFYVMKDYVNKGSVSHDNSGTTFFKEVSQNENKKKIDGGNKTDFNNVVFDSPVVDATDVAAFDLQGTITVEAEANFQKGIINNRNTGGVFILAEGGTATGAFDDSYVNGKVDKIGNTHFGEFPIGAYKEKHYRFSGISAPKDVSHIATAEYFYQDSNEKYPYNKKDNSITMVDNKEHWEMEGAENLILTLSWDEETTPNEFLKNPKAIRIAHWDNSLNKWKDLGGVVDEAAKTVSTPVTDEGIFTLALVDKINGDQEMKIFNLITPNEDDLNEFFNIEFKEGTTVNKLNLEIYNRWGVLVYQSNDYLSDDNHKFYGYSNAKRVYGKDNLLPSGTYFYVIDYDLTTEDKRNIKGKKVDHLYIAKEFELR